MLPIRLRWLWKVVLPIAVVLMIGGISFLAILGMERRMQFSATLIIIFSGVVLACGALLAILAMQVQRPIAELEEKISRVRDGDLSVRVSFGDRADEIGALGRDFNEMVTQIRQSREEIQRLHRTQMSRAEHFATLGELAAGLAHEVRNPLAGIAGFINVLGAELPQDSQLKDVIGDVEQEIQQINRILTDLLETARPKPPSIRLTDLNQTVEHAVSLARQQVLSKPIEISFIRTEGLPLVEHDPDQIHQVLLNLLLNSIQAIERSGNVRAEVVARGAFVDIVVSDNGRGIPAATLPNIFRPFFTTKGKKGTGLGLSLARRIVEQHGGTILAESAPGQGTKFVVSLPLTVAQSAPVTPAK